MLSILADAVSTGYDTLLVLAIMILVGMFAGRFFEKFSVPNITGFIIVGLVFGVLLLITNNTHIFDSFNVIMSVALGFIVFSIGMELDIKKMMKKRNEVLIITAFQALSAFAFTAIGLLIFNIPLPIALVLGAIGIATEPGPILLITKKYHTKGPLTDTLIPLHGIEDALAIMIFGGVLAFAVADSQGQSMQLIDILHGPIYELVFSILIAVAIGYIFKTIIKRLSYEDYEKDTVVFISALVAIMLSVAIANIGFTFFGTHVHLSPILLPMGVGITFANASSRIAKHETEHMIDQFSPPIMVAFFAMIGAEIVIILYQESEVLGFGFIALIAAVYVIFRIFGKLLGSYFGAKVTNADHGVRRYLGLCLLPQAQAAIGLAFYARYQLGNSYYGNLILTVVLLSAVVYELFGPFGVKYSLQKCHETDEFGNCIVPQK